MKQSTLDEDVPRDLWPRITPLKVDVEGNEILVSIGARNLLMSAYPLLIVAVLSIKAENVVKTLLHDVGHKKSIRADKNIICSI